MEREVAIRGADLALIAPTSSNGKKTIQPQTHKSTLFEGLIDV